MERAKTLDGRIVRLEPLTESHFEELCEIGRDPGLWKWTPNQPASREDLLAYLKEAMRLADTGSAMVFAARDKVSNRLCGSTRFAGIDLVNKKAEIGWTWLGELWQRTQINTEAMCLMLRLAFERWNFNRIEFKTDALNDKSRHALLRIGAKYEGTFRSHLVTDSGRRRDTMWFSILDSEWPAVKEQLEKRVRLVRNLPTYAEKSVPGSCFCGEVRFKVIGPTDFASHCHCDSCRRSHGSAFVTWTSVPQDRFEWISGEGMMRWHHSTPQVEWGFCANCGTSCLYRSQAAPEKIYVTVASLEENLERSPNAHYSYEERVPWCPVFTDLPRYFAKTNQLINH